MRARIAKIAAAVLIGGMVVVPWASTGAGAASTAPGSFSGNAAGDALVVSLGGNKLIGGDTTAADDNTPSSDATGSGELLPVLTGSQHATSTAPNTSQILPQVCGTPPVPSLPAPLGTLLSLGLGCGSAQSAVDGNSLPSSTGSGSAASINVGVGNLLTQVVTAGSPLAGALQTLFGALPALPAGGIDLGTLLTQLGVSAASTTGLLSVNAGSSTSAVTSTSSTVTATSSESGATISLLQGAGAGGGPAVTIAVGKASSAATLDRGAGTASATDDPALVTVTVSSALTPAQTITLNVGASDTVLAGTPLESTISVGSGTTTQAGGSASATSHGVTLDLLTGVDGGITIDLATGTASVNGVAPAAVTAVTTPPSAAAAAAPAAAPAAPAAPVAAAPAAVPNVTAVHTGEPWAGSLPLAATTLALGIAMVWRRRLLSFAGRIAHRFPGTGRGGSGGV